MSVVGITTKGNKEQAELIRLIMDNSKRIVVATGKAGTGKTFCALAAAIELLQSKRYQKIYYTRDVVQAGEQIGYLKGGEKEKLEPFLMPLYDTLDSIERVGKTIKANDYKQKIEFLPLFNIRGRNIISSCIIVDECENMSLNDIRTILTRGDEWTKIILLGSYTQIDSLKQRRQKKCDFEKAVETLSTFDFVGNIELIQPMRSSWCTMVDNALWEIEYNN